jgi:homoaconitate hydratase family protein
MAMTLTEKILSRGCGRDSVKPGEIVNVDVDRAMIHDNNAGLVIKYFNEIIRPDVWDPDKVVFFIDHHSPSTTPKAVKHHDTMRKFAAAQGISRFYDCGSGISHVVMLEEGLAGAGEIVVGTDSHTTGEGAMGSFATGIGATEMAAVLATGKVWLRIPPTIKIEVEGALPEDVDARDLMASILRRFGPDGANYCAVEFHGSACRNMSLDERTMCCVMSMEMGAKNALFSDEEHAGDARYSAVEAFDAGLVEPMVAVPSLPTNGQPAREVARQNIRIQQAAIVSCAGALLKDLAAASRILEGRKVASGTRLLVIPASRKIYSKALESGYLKILHDAGAIIGSPSCGACGGHDAGILAEGEVCISTSTKNMSGRMGAGGIVYLGSAATAAASAVRGVITDPREFLNEKGGA